jgi:hypothetical protein
MIAGDALFHCSFFNTALRRHRLRDEDRTSYNKRGRLPVGTEHSDTPPVLRRPRNKMGKPIFRLSYVVNCDIKLSMALLSFSCCEHWLIMN